MSGARRSQHRSCRRQRHRRRGLTLVELVVALGLAAVVLGGIFGVFSTTTRNLTSLERGGEMDQTARIVLDQLRRDIASLHPIQIEQEVQTDGTGEPETQMGVTFVGEDGTDNDGRPEDSLRFTATLPGASSASRRERTSAGQGDLAEVLYKLDKDESTPEHGLLRIVNWQPGLTGTESTPETTELAPTATSLQIRYYTETEREGADADGWCEDWQDTIAVPTAVAMTLGLTADTPGAVEKFVSLTLRTPLQGARYKPSRSTAGAGQPGESGADIPEVPTSGGGSEVK